MQSWKSENEVGRDRRFHACHVDRGAEPTKDTAYPFTLAFADFALFVASAKTGVYSVDINISKLNNIQTNHCFRFVPAPPSGKFDHIYTDAELYKAFNLPQKYIDVIEAVIKERK